MLHLDALFVVLYFIKVENFGLIIEDLEVPARRLRAFCVIYIGFSIKNRTFARYTSFESLVCKYQLIKSTFNTLE